MHIYTCSAGFSSFLVDILELPTTDDGKTLPDPLEHPPDDAEVGADLRAAATSRQKAPSGMFTVYLCNITDIFKQLQLIHCCKPSKVENLSKSLNFYRRLKVSPLI